MHALIMDTYTASACNMQLMMINMAGRERLNMYSG